MKFHFVISQSVFNTAHLPLCVPLQTNTTNINQKPTITSTPPPPPQSTHRMPLRIIPAHVQQPLLLLLQPLRALRLRLPRGRLRHGRVLGRQRLVLLEEEARVRGVRRGGVRGGRRPRLVPWPARAPRAAAPRACVAAAAAAALAAVLVALALLVVGGDATGVRFSTEASNRPSRIP